MKNKKCWQVVSRVHYSKSTIATMQFKSITMLLLPAVLLACDTVPYCTLMSGDVCNLKLGNCPPCLEYTPGNELPSCVEMENSICSSNATVACGFMQALSGNATKVLNEGDDHSHTSVPIWLIVSVTSLIILLLLGVAALAYHLYSNKLVMSTINEYAATLNDKRTETTATMDFCAPYQQMKDEEEISPYATCNGFRLKNSK